MKYMLWINDQWIFFKIKYMYLDYHHWINDLDNFPLNLDRNYQRIGENLFRFYQSRVMVNVKIHIEISHGKTHIFPKSIWLSNFPSRNLHTPPLRSQHCPLGRLRDSCLKTPPWGVGIHNFCGGFLKGKSWKIPLEMGDFGKSLPRFSGEKNRLVWLDVFSSFGVACV